MKAAAFCVLVLTAMTLGCGGDKQQTPTAPTPPVPVSDNWSISGHLVGYASGSAVAGAHVTSGDLGSLDTDAQGNFNFSGTAAPAKMQARVSLAADGYVTREASLTWQRGARNVSLDLIALAAPFSLDFYREIVRNARDEPQRSQPLRRWTENPRFYVRTVDESGQPVDPSVIAKVVATIPRAVQAFTAGRFVAQQIQQGSDARARTMGWINVIFRRDGDSTRCGQSTVGVSNGEVTFFVDRCTCGSVKMSGQLVMHEVGHAMGFWHVTGNQHVMNPFIPSGCPEGTPSAAEQFHVALAYTRAPGNLDPDNEPDNTLFATPPGDDLSPPVVTCPPSRD